MTDEDKRTFLVKYWGKDMLFSDSGETFGDSKLSGINQRGEFIDQNGNPWKYCKTAPEKKTRNMTGKELMGEEILHYNKQRAYLVTAWNAEGSVFLSGFDSFYTNCWQHVQDLVNDEFTLKDGSPLTVEI